MDADRNDNADTLDEPDVPEISPMAIRDLTCDCYRIELCPISGKGVEQAFVRNCLISSAGQVTKNDKTTRTILSYDHFDAAQVL